MFGNVREHIFGMTTIWLISEVTWKVMESFADSGLSSVGNLPEYIYIYIIYIMAISMRKMQSRCGF
jgi:hypothetical protein